jgi:hypothetical protein
MVKRLKELQSQIVKSEMFVLIRRLPDNFCNVLTFCRSIAVWLGSGTAKLDQYAAVSKEIPAARHSGQSK